MIVKISDNVFSPLGFGSRANYEALKRGTIGGKYYEGLYGLPEPCFVSIIDDGEIDSRFEAMANGRYSRFEKMMLLSVVDALRGTDIDVCGEDVVFILSTTKGNIRMLEEEDECDMERVNLWSSAQVLGDYFGLSKVPIVVSNACISGLSAQVLAMDYLKVGLCKYAVVVGVEELSKFIISGFQSFKALSAKQCKPFDENRDGLNLGEAAATVIYERIDDNEKVQGKVALLGGGICNDANHISAPSREGEGLLRAWNDARGMWDISQLAFINAHGTATRYNDDMESTAIYRAGLEGVAVNSLKGYFGHTLGAAGVLETIMSSYALEEGVALATAGYEKFGVVHSIHVNKTLQKVEGNKFAKMISGFGGSNAAALFEYIK